MFRTIAQTSNYEWPAYDSTPLYDRSSLGGLKADIRTVAASWFDQDAHESVERLVCHLLLAYAEFQPHDHYTGSTRYEMSQLLRVFSKNSTAGATRLRSLSTSRSTSHYVVDSASRRYPISQHCGEAGTSGLLPILEIPLGRLRG